ncbi:MAG TPA: hypothetical protein VMT37_08610 [Solirubrobacterales bacterium]|nr:hypothetical protein [Solirubrobacterales bacterium]
MKQIRKRLTFSNVVACLALFVALGGASYAATQLPKNSIGTKQLKKHAVTRGKIKMSTLGTVPDSAKLGGLPASSYSIRSAVILANGAIASGQADGIAQENVSVATPGLICIAGLDPAPRTAVASLAFNAFNGDDVFVAVNPTVGGCAGKQVAIATERPVGITTVEPGGVFRADPVAVIVH